MNMTKKIAVTASTLLFVLAQIFSFYIIYENQQQKIDLVIEKESQTMFLIFKNFYADIRKYSYQNQIDERILVKCYRDNMQENSALYKNEVCLFNNTNYEFNYNLNPKKIERNNFVGKWMEKKIGEKRILINYAPIQGKEDNYISYHVMDVTALYESSRHLMVKEILFSLFLSAGMAVLLVLLIRKITEPLKETNKIQHQLIGSMSHELKTPLTAIQGYSETLLHVKLSSEQSQKALSYITSESGRLARLSEKMMELTRLYEPECKIALKEVSVKALLEDVKKSVGHELKKKEITLKVALKKEDLVSALDRDLMISFLINLIKNSIMASQPGSSIEMGADEREIWVKDEGCGIPEREVAEVRKAFYRVDKSRSRKSGNMGLGLSICEQIAKVHKASMRIESQEGKGTKISFLYKSVTDR